MKIAIPAVLFTFLLSLSASEPATTSSPISPQTKSENGRYQIHQYTIDLSVDDIKTKQNLLIRIDTVTGQTWKYFHYLRNDKFIEGWVEIPTLERKDQSPPQAPGR
jgi:hypothetical protein